MIVFDQLRKNDPHLRTVTWGVLAGMCILFVGLWWVQVVSHRRYSENQKAQSFRTVRIPAVRGQITDKHRVALAENRPSYNVILYLDELREQFRAEYARARKPHLVTNALPFWKRWLGMNPVKAEYTRLNSAQRLALERAVRYRVASNAVHQVSTAIREPIPFEFDEFMRHYTNQLALPLPVLQNLDSNQIARLLEGGASPPGVDIEIQPLREYPGGTLAAHLLGYLGRDNSSMEGEVADFSFRMPDFRGRTGIEWVYDAQLRGKAGEKFVLVNSLGYRQSETVWSPAEPGKNVVLTIDATIQFETEKALREAMPTTRGAAVVLDLNTGDILAMASAPTFDPNWYIPRLSHEAARWMADDYLKPQINRAMQMNYHPGSIFKIITGLAALESGLNPAQVFTVNSDPEHPGKGCIYIGRRKIKDLAAAGDYDFRKAFIHSSNSYFITNGMKAGIEAIVGLGQRLHFGELTRLIPRQETSGNFPTLANVRRGWHDGETANICIGQGQIDITPLQIAIMIGAIANGGKVYWPRLVDRIESGDPNSVEPPTIFPPRLARDELNVNPRSLKILREAMVADVEEGGTGQRALVRGFQIGGKTGTAEINDPAHPSRVMDHTTWFASCGPMENPRYVVVVMVESGASGGGTCAPAVGKIYQAIQKLEQKTHPAVARLP